MASIYDLLSKWILHCWKPIHYNQLTFALVLMAYGSAYLLKRNYKNKQKKNWSGFKCKKPKFIPLLFFHSEKLTSLCLFLLRNNIRNHKCIHKFEIYNLNKNFVHNYHNPPKAVAQTHPPFSHLSPILPLPWETHTPYSNSIEWVQGCSHSRTLYSTSWM